MARAMRKELDRGFAGEEVVPEPVLEQLRVQHATVVPYGFGVRTMLKVDSAHHSGIASAPGMQAAGFLSDAH